MSKKISELDANSALDGSELIEIVQGGANKKVTINDLLPVHLQADRTVDLNGNALQFQYGGNNFLLIDPTVNGENSQLAAFNSTGGGSYASDDLITTDVLAEFYMNAAFDGESKVVEIHGLTNTTTSELTYTADTHTFNAGANQYLKLDGVGFITDIEASDGTASSRSRYRGDLVGNHVSFSLVSEDGTTDGVEIFGDGQAQTIEYTADAHTFNGSVITPDLLALDFVDDAAATGGGVAVGQWYHTSGTLKIRLS